MPIGNELESPVVSAITLDRDVAKVTVSGFAELGVSTLFREMAECGVNVDVIVHDKATRNCLSVGFTVGHSDLEKAVAAIQKKWGDTLAIDTRKDLAKVSAVGLGMKTYPGVAAQVLETLAKERSEVIMISTSEIKISCVVPINEAERAVQSLHEVFFPT